MTQKEIKKLFDKYSKENGKFYEKFKDILKGENDEI